MTLWVEGNFKYQPCTNISLANNFILCKSEKQFIKCIENQGHKIFDCYFREHTDPVMSPYYCAPVYFAIRRAYTQALIKLIELGQEIQNYPVDVDHPPLIPFACSIVRTEDCPSSGGLSTNEYRKQQMQILHLLLDKGADINALDSDNKSGLQHLLDNKGPRLFIGYEWSFAYMLLQRGAHINVRFHDGRRADQVLLKYLNSSKYMEFCPLSPKERQEIVDKIYESNHQYAFSELVEIAARIKEAVKKVVSLEEELYFHPEHFRENSSYHHSLNGSLAFLESRKKQILKDMKRLGEALNYCGKEIRPVSNSTKNVLSLSITLITRKLVKENIRTYLPNITKKCQKEIYSILDEITFRKDSLPFFQNLIPSDFFGGCVLKTKSPFYKQEVLPNEAQYTLDSLQNYFKYQNNHFLNLIQKKILQFMDDQSPLEDLMITSTNARQYLIEVKLIDIALAAFIKSSSPKINFQNSTYPIRTRILEVASPFMTTCEAYTKTLDSRKIKNRSYLMNSAHWVTERTGIYCKIIANQLILAASLSKRLNHYVPSIWAIRGNTGVGKTEAIAKDSGFKNGLDEEGKLSGKLNPDAFKHILKKVHPLSPSTFISNQQVHEEGVALFRSYQNGLKKDALNASTIMDTRFSTIEDIEDNLLIPAKKEQKEVLFLDIEAPLITSLNRVLTRDPFGLDPCPPLADIVKGYKESIIYRKKFLQMVVNDSSIHFYKLYSQNEEGVRQLVAEKRQEIFKVYSKELLDKSTQLCSNKKIESDLNQVITPQYIDQAIKHHDIPEICRFLLESWMDVKIGKAVEMHSLGILPSQASELIKQEIFYNEKYGEISILPFSKTWLEDFPYLFHHLESEHLLHIRGVDEDGRGLHWQTNKFAWRLNPELNPEAKVEEASKGGFQMRLGYFILPLSRIDILKSDSLSNSILNELEIRNEAKELIGYRFFVHPEAYTHYRALHDQNIPFVKPEHSDFIGTPSSAYRSWVIRRIQKRSEHYIAAADSIPFVVKLGVEGKKSNTDKLLTKEMIRKSIDRQMDFDKMSSIDLKPNPEASNLLFFQETFGLILKNIQNYPPCSPCDAEPKDSGMLIREFPNEFLKGRYKIINFSALMSLERLKPENAVVILDNAEMSQLPIIFEVIEAAIKKGEIKTPYAFVEKYLIDGYIKAIEKVFFENKMALLPHAQNLCLALNPDNTPYGFVYRDFEEINDDGIGFIESYSWYYRYHVFIKLLNVITRSESGFTPAPAGAPTQIGYDTPLDERNLNYYLTQNLKNPKSLKKMKELSLSCDEASLLLNKLDGCFLNLLSTYFDISKLQIEKGHIPAAESGSIGESATLLFNKKLWEHKKLFGVVPLG